MGNARPRHARAAEADLAKTEIASDDALRSYALIDAPYRKSLTEAALVALRDGGWLSSNAVIVAETAADGELVVPDTFREHDRRSYGETQVIVLIAA